MLRAARGRDKNSPLQGWIRARGCQEPLQDQYHPGCAARGCSGGDQRGTPASTALSSLHPSPTRPLPTRGSSLLSPSSRFNHFVRAACPCLHSPIPPPRPAPSPRLPPPLPPLSIYFQLSRRFTLRFGSAASDLGCLPPLCAPALAASILAVSLSPPLPGASTLGMLWPCQQCWGLHISLPPALKRSSTHPVNAADPGAAQQKQQCARGIALPHPLAVSLRAQLWVWGCRSSTLAH